MQMRCQFQRECMPCQIDNNYKENNKFCPNINPEKPKDSKQERKQNIHYPNCCEFLCLDIGGLSSNFFLFSVGSMQWWLPARVVTSRWPCIVNLRRFFCESQKARMNFELSATQSHNIITMAANEFEWVTRVETTPDNSSFPCQCGALRVPLPMARGTTTIMLPNASSVPHRPSPQSSNRSEQETLSSKRKPIVATVSRTPSTGHWRRNGTWRWSATPCSERRWLETW